MKKNIPSQDESSIRAVLRSQTYTPRQGDWTAMERLLDDHQGQRALYIDEGPAPGPFPGVRWLLMGMVLGLMATLFYGWQLGVNATEPKPLPTEKQTFPSDTHLKLAQDSRKATEDIPSENETNSAASASILNTRNHFPVRSSGSEGMNPSSGSGMDNQNSIPVSIHAFQVSDTPKQASEPFVSVNTQHPTSHTWTEADHMPGLMSVSSLRRPIKAPVSTVSVLDAPGWIKPMQRRWSLGFIGGAQFNLTQAQWPEDIQPLIGIVSRYQLPHSLFLQGGLNLQRSVVRAPSLRDYFRLHLETASYNEATTKLSDKDKQTMYHVLLPIGLGWRYNRWESVLGGYVGLNLTQGCWQEKLQLQDASGKSFSTCSLTTTRMDFGIWGGVGYAFHPAFRIGAHYQHGLKNAFNGKPSNGYVPFSNTAVQLSLLWLWQQPL